MSFSCLLLFSDLMKVLCELIRNGRLYYKCNNFLGFGVDVGLIVVIFEPKIGKDVGETIILKGKYKLKLQ